VKKLIILLFGLICIHFNGKGQNTSITEQFTEWSVTANWSSGFAPASNTGGQDIVVDGSVRRNSPFVLGAINIFGTGVPSDLTVKSGDSLVILGDLTINPDSQLIIENGAYLYVDGDLNNNGEFFLFFIPTGEGGSASNDGVIAVNGDYNQGFGADIDNGNGDFYVEGDSGSTPNKGNIPPEIQMIYTILPIELKSFSVSKRGETIDLDWVTAKEENFSHFEIERAGSDMNFEVIGIMEGSGNSLSDILYNYQDYSSPFGQLYYRLNAIDLDGSSEYSKTVSVNKTFDGAAKIYPNPANHQETVRLELPNDFNQLITSLSIYDPTGQLIKTYEDFDPVADELNFNTLQDGIFIIKLNYNGLVENIRIVVR